MSIILYLIELERVADGKRALVEFEWDTEWCKTKNWDDDGPDYRTWYQWTEGNYSCDCNRHNFFEWEFGRDGAEIGSPEHQCGDERYELISIFNTETMQYVDYS